MGRYPPDRFEHISFQKPVSLIHSAGHERTWRQNERTWMQNERTWMQSERNMRKGDERKLKQKMTSVDSRPRMLSPTESWKIHTYCLQGAHHLRKRWVKKTDNMILGNLKRYRVFIQPHVVPNMISCSQPDLGPILPVSVLSRWLNCVSSSPHPRCFKAKKHNRGMSSCRSP